MGCKWYVGNVENKGRRKQSSQVESAAQLHSLQRSPCCAWLFLQVECRHSLKISQKLLSLIDEKYLPLV